MSANGPMGSTLRFMGATSVIVDYTKIDIGYINEQQIHGLRTTLTFLINAWFAVML